MFFLEIDTGGRCCDDEFYAVSFGKNGELVGADFIGCVSVPDDSVRAYYYSSDILFRLVGLEERSSHGVSDQRRGNLLVNEFEGCESGTLVIWSGFGTVGMIEVIHVVEFADYP